MEIQEIVLEKLKSQFSDVEFSTEEFRNELSIKLDKKHIVNVCKFLKEDTDLQFVKIDDLTAIDWATRSHRFTVVYIIYSFAKNCRIKLKVDVEDSNCEVESVTSVWSGANWMEREAFDMYGIKFLHHPDLRRMYMPEEFEYHPLRKEFPVIGIPNSLTLPRK